MEEIRSRRQRQRQRQRHRERGAGWCRGPDPRSHFPVEQQGHLRQCAVAKAYNDIVFCRFPTKCLKQLKDLFYPKKMPFFFLGNSFLLFPFNIYIFIIK